MKVEVFPNAEAAAAATASRLAHEARAAVVARGSFQFAVSGGASAGKMLRDLAQEDVPWEAVHLFQVDERVAPPGHPDRNLTDLWENLVARGPLSQNQLHAMPVEEEDLEGAADRYAEELRDLAGHPPALDLVHLGLGTDGHTASLVPGDGVLAVHDADVAVTARPYHGRRRMTLTYPTLDRSRTILWLITERSKAEILRRLLDGDPVIPAGRVRAENAEVLADEAGASLIHPARGS